MNTYLQSFSNQVKAEGFPKLDTYEVYDAVSRMRCFQPDMGKLAISSYLFGKGEKSSVVLTFFGYDKILRQLKVYTLNDTTDKLHMEFRRVEVDEDYYVGLSDDYIKRTHEFQHVEQGHDLKFTTKVETFDSVEEASSRALEIVSLYGHIFPPSMYTNNL